MLEASIRVRRIGLLGSSHPQLHQSQAAQVYQLGHVHLRGSRFVHGIPGNRGKCDFRRRATNLSPWISKNTKNTRVTSTPRIFGLTPSHWRGSRWSAFASSNPRNEGPRGVAARPSHVPCRIQTTLLDRLCFFLQENFTFRMRLTGFPAIMLSERQAVAQNAMH